MAEFLSDGDRESDANASPLRSGSTDWELVLSTPSSPVLQSGEELAGLEIGAVHDLSLPGPAFAPDGLVQDDYFGYEASDSDFSPTSLSMGEDMDESAVQCEGTGGTGLSGDSDDSDNPHIRASPLPVSPDAGSIEASSPPRAVVERDEAVSQSTFESHSGAEDIRIDDGLQLSREFYQDDPSLQLFSLPEPSTDFPSNSNTPRSDADRSGEQGIHDHGQSFVTDEGGQSVVANDTEGFGLVLGDGNAENDIGANRRRLEEGPNKGLKSPSCDCWLQRQLCLWQARLGQAKTLCSLTLAAAIVGILILGQGWQRLRAQNRTLLLQLRGKDKKITQLMFQLLQMKESLSKTRQIPVIRAKPSLQIPQDRS